MELEMHIEEFGPGDHGLKTHVTRVADVQAFVELDCLETLPVPLCRAIDHGRPIFVVGPPRSGTTLVARMLDRHSRLFMPGETHFFEDIYAFRATIGDFASPDARERVVAKFADHYKRYWEPKDQERIERIMREQPEKWAHWRDGMRSYRDALDGFMKVQMEVEGKVRWGNNVPKDIFYVDEICELYPEARFIVCVRDPRDVLISYKKKWKVTGDEHVERLRQLYHPVMTSLLWKASVRQLSHLKARVPAGHWIVVRYEDLVNEPKAVISRVCQIIDEDFEAQMLEVREDNSSSSQPRSGIFTTSLGRWRSELEEADAVVAQQLTAREMHSFGYEREEVDASRVALVLKYCSAPLAFIRAMIANVGMRGPLLPYLSKRLKSLFSTS